MSEPIALSPEIVGNFAEVVMSCLRRTIGVEAVVAAVCEPAGPLPTITVALDLGGDVRGPVTWVFPQEIALELVRRLMEDPHPDPGTATDGATELANILTGSATDILEQRGFRCHLGVPRVHVGALPSGVLVHMSTGAGPIELVLSLQTGDL